MKFRTHVSCWWATTSMALSPYITCHAALYSLSRNGCKHLTPLGNWGVFDTHHLQTFDGLFFSMRIVDPFFPESSLQGVSLKNNSRKCRRAQFPSISAQFRKTGHQSFLVADPTSQAIRASRISQWNTRSSWNRHRENAGFEPPWERSPFKGDWYPIPAWYKVYIRLIIKGNNPKGPYETLIPIGSMYGICILYWFIYR